MAALALLLVVALELPAGFYIAAEFLTRDTVLLLWRLGPATFAWEVASPSRGVYWSGPTWPLLAWPLLAWPGVAAAGTFLSLLADRRTARSA